MSVAARVAEEMGVKLGNQVSESIIHLTDLSNLINFAQNEYCPVRGELDYVVIRSSYG